MRLGVPDSSLCAQSQLPRIVSLVKSSFVFPLVRWAAKVALSRRLRPSGRQRRIPEPQRYAKLRAKARAGTRPINHGEPPERPHFSCFAQTPVGLEGLQPAKAREIHPIKQLAER